MSDKMNVLLAKADHAQSVYNKAVLDQTKYFKNNQGDFKGIKKTYAAREGYLDDPSKREDKKVKTTVKEQFDWFKETLKKYWRLQFAEEATNSAGAKKVNLTYDGINFGDLTALDLMRLKSLLCSKEFKDIFNNIPVRDDSKVWTPVSGDDNPEGRELFQDPLLKGTSKTLEKEDIILKDPNIDPQHLPSNYRATTTTKTKQVEIGDYTVQNFSGEWTPERKAKLLRKISGLTGAVITALKEVNESEALQPNVNVDSLADFILG